VCVCVCVCVVIGLDRWIIVSWVYVCVWLCVLKLGKMKRKREIIKKEYLNKMGKKIKF